MGWPKVKSRDYDVTNPPVCFPTLTHISSYWHETSLLTLKLTVAHRRHKTDVFHAYSHVVTHTVHPDTHTGPFITQDHGPCEGQAQADKSFFWHFRYTSRCLSYYSHLLGKIRLLWKTFCDVTCERGSVCVSVDGQGSQVFGRYFFTSEGGYFVISVFYGLL